MDGGVGADRLYWGGLVVQRGGGAGAAVAGVEAVLEERRGGVLSGLTVPETAAPLIVSVDGDPPDTSGGDDGGDAGGGEDGCGAL